MRFFLAILCIVSLVAFIGWWIYTSPAFRVSVYEISGNIELGRAEILLQIDETEGKHFTWILLNPPLVSLLLHPIIKEASLSIRFPSTLSIAIEERKAIALIPYHNYFLRIDDEGVILSLVTSIRPDVGALPFITGLDLPLLAVGERVPQSHNLQAGIRTVLGLSPLLLSQTSEIDVTSAMRVIIRTVDNITIDIGEGYLLERSNTNLLSVINYVRGNNLGTGSIMLTEDGIIWSGDDLDSDSDIVSESDELGDRDNAMIEPFLEEEILENDAEEGEITE